MTEAPSGETHEERVQRAARATTMHQMVGMGRRIRACRAIIAEYEEEYALLLADCQRLIDEQRAQEQALVEALQHVALLRREARMGNYVEVPGLGRVGTRKAADRFGIDNEVVLRDLQGDDRKQFIDPGEPKPAEPKVRGDVLRKHLQQLFDDTCAATVFPDDEALAERKRIEIAERIAAQFPGVTFVPGEVTPTEIK